MRISTEVLMTNRITSIANILSPSKLLRDASAVGTWCKVGSFVNGCEITDQVSVKREYVYCGYLLCNKLTDDDVVVVFALPIERLNPLQ